MFRQTDRSWTLAMHNDISSEKSTTLQCFRAHQSKVRLCSGMHNKEAHGLGADLHGLKRSGCDGQVSFGRPISVTTDTNGLQLMLE